MRQTPSWVMKNFTHSQLLLVYRKMKKVEFDYVELQSRLVWAVGNGWKRPKQIDGNDLDALKATGLMGK